MTKKFPTVEELVQIFKDHNWKPALRKSQFTGIERESDCEGHRCIIPALLVYEGKFDEVYDSPHFSLQSVYNSVREKYGEHVWEGFDGNARRSSRPEVYQLSKGLREALEKSLKS